MDINHIHLAVQDVDESQKFYETHFGFRQHVRHGKILFLRNEAGFDLALNQSGSDAGATAGLVQHEPDFVWFRAKDPDGYAIEVYWE